MSYLIYLACFILGWKFREYTAVRKITKMMQEVEQAPKELNKLTVKIEKHNNVFYLYNIETNEFLTQGKSKEEIQDNLKARFGNIDMAFHATSENINEVGFK
jgi:hypothetical protein